MHSLHLHSHFSPLTPLSPPSHSSLVYFSSLRPFLSLRPTSSSPSIAASAQVPSPQDSTSSINQESEDGPLELPPSYSPFSSSSTLFAVDDNPSALQVATSVLLTGAISVFLFRSLRRRAKNAKELKLRSTGVTKAKDVKEEALERLKAMGTAPVDPGGPPSPIQALLGAVGAGVIALILYKFTTTVEAALNRQTISDTFSVRQITITVRTIINGICYLATFVFGINSVGLLLYSIQLTFNSFTGSPAGDSKSSETDVGQSNITNDTAVSSTENADSRSSGMKESSDDS